MKYTLMETVGIYLVLAAVIGMVAAAAMISVALAVFVGAFFGVLAGTLLIIVASHLERGEKAQPKDDATS